MNIYFVRTGESLPGFDLMESDSCFESWDNTCSLRELMAYP